MNHVQLNMLDILKRLHDEHDIIGVKAEFEAEGSRINELVQLNEITDSGYPKRSLYYFFPANHWRNVRYHGRYWCH